MKNNKKESILVKLKKSLSSCGCLNQEEFLQIKKAMFPKLGLNFELFENDIYQKHIESNKYVFLEKHPSCPDFFNSGAKTFGSLIEADGLMAMFLLQNIYKGKVDLIYNVPPYNSGTMGFMYSEKYRFSGNPNSLMHINKNDSFNHSKWLSMMQLRLEQCKDLLSDSGLIAISIDDSEMVHLKLLMDRVFGNDCYKGTIVWSWGGGSPTLKNILKTHEYILVYEKLVGQSQFYFEFEKQFTETPLIKGGRKGKKTNSTSYWYPITYNDQTIWPINNQKEEQTWTLSKTKFESEIEKGNIIFKKTIKGNWMPQWKHKQFKTISRLKSVEEFTECPICKKLKKNDDSYLKNIEEFIKKYHQDVCQSDDSSYLKNIEEFPNGGGTKDLKSDLGQVDLWYLPKPVQFLKHLFKNMCPKNGLIVDFAAGSGTTGCAVAELNKEDEGKRRFILIENHDGGNLDRTEKDQIKRQQLDNDSEHKICPFHKVMYARLQKNQKKYDVSCKVFLINDLELAKLDGDETFFSQQEKYVQTCVNLLSILNAEKKEYTEKEMKKNNYQFEINGLHYGFFEDKLDVNMRFDFSIKKEPED